MAPVDTSRDEFMDTVHVGAAGARLKPWLANYHWPARVLGSSRAASWPRDGRLRSATARFHCHARATIWLLSHVWSRSMAAAIIARLAWQSLCPLVPLPHRAMGLGHSHPLVHTCSRPYTSPIAALLLCPVVRSQPIIPSTSASTMARTALPMR